MENEEHPVDETDDAALEAESFSAKLKAFQQESAAAESQGGDEPQIPLRAEDPPPPKAAEADPDEPAEIELPELGAVPSTAAPKPFDEAAFDAETDAETKNLPADQANRWKLLKAKVKEAKLKEAEAAAIIANAKPSPAMEAELARLKKLEAETEALRQRNQELLAANDQTSVRESDEFKRAITTPLDEMATVIQAMATASEVEPSILASIIEEKDVGKQDRMIDALDGKLSRRTISRIERLADDYKIITSKEREMLAEAGKTLEQQRVVRQQEVKAEEGRKVQVFQAAVEDSFKRYASIVPGFTDSSGNLTDLGQAIRDKTQQVDVLRLDNETLGYMAYSANALPELRKELVKLRRENAVLRGTKPRPAVTTGAPAAFTPPGDDVLEDGLPMGLVDRMRGMKFTGVGAS